MIDLEKLRVRLEAPAAPDERAILECLAERARACAATTELAVVNQDCEVLVHAVLTDTEGLIPGGCLEDARIWPQHPTLGPLHGLLVGREVGEIVDGRAVLATAGPVAARAEIVRAQAVRPLDLEAPEQLKQLGLGASLHDVCAAIAGELMERARAEVWTRARESIFDQLLELADVDARDAEVDALLHARFDNEQAPVIAHLCPERFEPARAAFVGDAPNRALCERKIKVQRALQAVAQQENIKLTTSAVDDARALLGDELASLARDDRELDDQLTNLAMHLATITHVMAKANVEEPAPIARPLDVRLTRD